MKVEALPSEEGNYNLQDYNEMSGHFEWEDAYRHFTWHDTGRVNIAYEAIDRHAESANKDKIALYFFDNNRNEKYTFQEMKWNTNKAANVLKQIGIKKGDHVAIFMPRTPELYFSLFGILKTGAVACPIFDAFMEDAIRDRLEDSGAKAIITTPELLKRVPVAHLPELKHVLLAGEEVKEEGLYMNFNTRMASASEDFNIEWVDLEDGMIIHYTAGSSGTLKGIYHVHQAMVQIYQTSKWVLDLKENDIYWCTANPSWITGTCYGAFGPWLAGCTNVIHGGRFNPEDWFETIERYSVSVWYSAPTAFRMLMGAGDSFAKKYDLSSLRHILSVGEPLSPEIIRWGMNVFKTRIHDTWLMTETGSILISNYSSLDIKPGSMGKALPGIEAAIIDDHGNKLPPNQTGNIAIKKGWPSMMRKIWRQPEKYLSYFTKNGWFVTGDSGYMDDDGYFWYQGRIDDVIMTSRERIGPFEIENKLREHPAVAEAGVIGKPDPKLGEVIKAYIVLKEGFYKSKELELEIRSFVKKGLSAEAAPREIEFRDKLPKTRSGKIMRRVLKEWESCLPK